MATYKLRKEALEGNQSCQHLHLGPVAYRTVRKQVSLVEVTQSVGVLCYGSPSKLIQRNSTQPQTRAASTCHNMGES